MEKYFRTLITLLCMGMASVGFAQLYVIDDNFADSVQVYEVKLSDDGQKQRLGQEAFKLPMGDTVKVVRLLDDEHNIGVVSIDGKEYVMKSNMLLFSDANPAGTEDIFGDTRSRTNHSTLGKFFATMTPYWIIAILFIVAMVFTWLGFKGLTMRNIALKVVPACILGASLLEIWAFTVMNTDAFWWCSPDRFGFFGALFRVIPFIIFVGFQLYSIKLYMLLLTEDDDNNLSVKPMLLSFGLCIPITVAVSLLCSGCFGMGSPWIEIVTVIVFAISLGVGLVISAKRNFEELGKTRGMAFTLFGIVWAIGAIVAILGIIIIIFQLILQMLFVAAMAFGLSFAMKNGAKEQPRTMMFRDDDGNLHTNSVDRDSANQRIQERKNNN